ncbi:HAD-IIIC family phosphatase [Streptomyces sp. NPDC002588]|uniref:HAD-IIIC family phosphatase n=1 Tax=Streptomyces sp. NPDC002588 TaxID=3154419 RepID=UPI003325D372
MSSDHGGSAADPLKELRSLKRAGLRTAVPRVRALLRGIPDALGLESAGALLSGAGAREQLGASGLLVQQRIAVLGSSTLDTLAPLLTAVLVREGLLPETRLAGYNQWRFEVLSGAPALKDLEPQIVALLLDDTAVFEEVTDPLDITQIEERCAAFPATLAQWVRSSREVLGGLTVLTTVPLAPLRRDRIVDYAAKARLEAAWHRMNAGILALAEESPSTVVLSHEAPAARAGSVFGGPRMRHIAAHVFSPEFLAEYAQELARVARAEMGRAAKCLVLDLDNTLWGGVVGDDGVGALRLGGAYPGSAHQELQALARDFMRQGVMLAVASKNDEATAREAVATHPEMVLGPDAFVAFHAHWGPKPDSVRQLTADLNIGADALVFVDDNPVERGLMREAQPAVATVELPRDPAEYAAHLAARGDFNLLRLTEEDRGRTDLYRARARRAVLAESSTDLESYLAALEPRLSVEPAGPLNTARISQLFGKTNQFNLTGIRYAEAEVARRLADGSGRFLGARLTDRFGDNGLIAALALGTEADGSWTIENFVLSCRVFSRRVEDTLVGLVLRAAREHGAPAVTARFSRTAKNTAFAGFYAAQGFAVVGEDSGATLHRHSLTDLPGLPRYMSVTDEEGVFDVR